MDASVATGGSPVAWRASRPPPHSEVHARHVRIPIAGRDALRCDFVDATQIDGVRAVFGAEMQRKLLIAQGFLANENRPVLTDRQRNDLGLLSADSSAPPS